MAPAVLIGHYEELRAQALAGMVTSGTGRGLAVLLRRGLAAWLVLCQELLIPRPGDAGEPRTLPRPSADPGALPAAIQADLVRALASMVLGSAEKGGA